jgi:hypothetical protein
MAFYYRGNPAYLIPHPIAGHGDGKTYGAAEFPPLYPRDPRLRVIFSGVCDEYPDWEHVSVSTAIKTPTWEDMCFIKGLFWDREDCVVQFHPPRSLYVNNHPFCLHLWRNVKIQFPLPPAELIR